MMCESLSFAASVLCLLWLPAHAANPVLLSAPKEVRAVPGGSFTVSCHYNHLYRDYTKYWCKGQPYELCTIVVKTPKNRWNGRVFITDHKEMGLFNVTMMSLEKKDEGMYWCVIARKGRNIFTGVRLRISHTGRRHLLWWIFCHSTDLLHCYPPKKLLLLFLTHGSTLLDSLVFRDAGFMR